MKKNKKLLLLASTVATITLGASLAIACKSEDTSIINTKNYDVGLSTSPINSLNYLKNKNTFIVIPALVESAIKSGPSSEVKDLLAMPKVSWGAYLQNIRSLDELDPQISPRELRSRYYQLDDLGITTGVGDITTPDNLSFYTVGTPENKLFTVRTTLNNGRSRWVTENINAVGYNDAVTPQDFIDAAQYILDINNGSQLLTAFLQMNIKNARQVVDAQKEYLAKFGVPYRDPFSRKTQNTQQVKVPSGQTLEIADEASLYEEGTWPSQNDGDEAERLKIKAAASALGIYVGEFGPVDDTQIPDANSLEAFLKKPKHRYADPRQTWRLDETNNVVGRDKVFAQTKWDLRWEFEETNPVSTFTFLNDLINNNALKPINRRFVESIGGFQYFGISKQSFMWNGPFDPEELLLGDQGYILLKKREQYYSSSKTLSERIKIYFQTQATVTASMFVDGLITQTNIPTEYILQFWQDASTRSLMQKKQGFGTVAFQMNLDNETNKNPALQDQDFRNALWFAINREDVQKIVGLDTSFPVANWTAFGQAKNSKGVPLEQWFEKVEVTAKNNVKHPLVLVPYLSHLAKSFTFENVNRNDNNFDLETAKWYLQQYKDKNPGVKQVTLEFVYDSSELQGKAAIALKALLETAFDNFVTVDIKAYPSNVFEDFRAQGKFDVTFANFDYFGSDYNSYIQAFHFPDQIETKTTIINGQEVKQNKTFGFRENPSGSWTYGVYFASLSDAEKLATRQRLQIPQKHWDKMIELANIKTSETQSQHRERINAFFSFLFTDQELAEQWDENEIFALIISYEKIIRDGAPIIPVVEIDTQWEVTRLGGVESSYTYQLQFAYDYRFPPRAGLPTKTSS